jgi:hypothetical protein
MTSSASDISDIITCVEDSFETLLAFETAMVKYSILFFNSKLFFLKKMLEKTISCKRKKEKPWSIS